MFDRSLLSALDSVLFVVSAAATNGSEDSCSMFLTRIISRVFKLSPAVSSMHSDLYVEYQQICSPF